MKLVHRDYNFVYEFRENCRAVLVVENMRELRAFTQELINSECSCGLVLSDNNEVVDINDSLVCIHNVFELSLNERRILNKLLDRIKREVNAGEMLLDNNAVYARIEQYAIKIQQLFDFELEYNEATDVQSLLKFMNIRFKEQVVDVTERIVDYVRVSSLLLKIDCFVFVNIYAYLDKDEIDKLYKYFQYNKINVLFVEGKQPTDAECFDWMYIIDKNCCEINVKGV